MQLKLEAIAISKQFANNDAEILPVLEEVSLQVKPCEFVSIVGASGCGKTTFLRILDGLIPPTSGGLLIDGREVTAPDHTRGFVFQNDSLWPWRTAMGNVLFGLQIQHRPRREAKEIAQKLIDLVGLKGFESHYPHQLSGGMRQRINIARALAISPDVLLMDEPFASLDAQTREVMQLELVRICDAERKTVVFVTHQIEEAVFLSDRIVVFAARPGRVKEILDIELPRPRRFAIKRSREFIDYVDRVWHLLEVEVFKSSNVRRPH
ncbi:MAG: ABC transporter ATP-binding protein [Xanthobacteraceae bacterium]|jgi:NitT/TauT family transport system ATP-binding protein